MKSSLTPNQLKHALNRLNVTFEELDEINEIHCGVLIVLVNYVIRVSLLTPITIIEPSHIPASSTLFSALATRVDVRGRGHCIVIRGMHLILSLLR